MNILKNSCGDYMTKHKLFISYYHNDDEYYRNRFEELFGDLFINKSVKLGDIDEDLSTEYVKRLIRENYISDSSVVVVLVGENTHCRKHVDWEISAGLLNNAGLIGLALPSHSSYKKDKYSSDNVPARLDDNLKSGYASFYDWTENKAHMVNRIEKAFENKSKKKDDKVNSRKQMKYNGCS